MAHGVPEDDLTARVEMLPLGHVIHVAVDDDQKSSVAEAFMRYLGHGVLAERPLGADHWKEWTTEECDWLTMGWAEV